ncbi:MAG: hypothetical protein VKJ04_10935 [Vampirovibrionales bacterium]|nr:hypothetical protein [Vampirovibrionales bacterium]
MQQLQTDYIKGSLKGFTQAKAALWRVVGSVDMNQVFRVLPQKFD